MSMNVFLIGSSGLVGKAVYEGLATDPSGSTLVAFNRRRLGLQGGIERVSDLSDFRADMNGLKAELAFCAVGTTIRKAKSRQAFEEVDLNLPLRFAVAAKEHGVQCFHVVTALGADPHSQNFYLRTKGVLERELKNVGFDSLHIYRPSLLVGDRGEFRLAERISIAAFRSLKGFYPKILDRYKPIEVPKLAGFILRKMKDETRGLYIWENRDMISG
jgi:uncharacterized protein YbjT (DUF2867 family)